MIRISEWRLKLVLSIPSVSIFAISIAMIRISERKTKDEA